MGLSKMQKDDYEWYIDNFDALYKKYGKAFIVISNKKVLGSYPTAVEGVHSMYNKNIDFIVQECAKTKEEIIKYINNINNKKILNSFNSVSNTEFLPIVEREREYLFY